MGETDEIKRDTDTRRIGGHGPRKKTPKPEGMLPLTKVVRLYCLSCVGDESWKEVELCQCPKCHLWPWRHGKRPDIAEAQGRLTDPAKFVAETLVASRRDPSEVTVTSKRKKPKTVLPE